MRPECRDARSRRPPDWTPRDACGLGPREQDRRMTAPPAASSLAADVAARVSSYWKLKFVGITTFIAIFFVGYFLLLRFPVFHVTIMPLTALDRMIPFQPGTLWLYLSLWFYVSLPPTLMRERPKLYAYCRVSAVLALVGLAI